MGSDEDEEKVVEVAVDAVDVDEGSPFPTAVDSLVSFSARELFFASFFWGR